MRKKILFYSKQDELDRNVMSPCDYDSLYDGYVKQGGGNSGNKLFVYSLEKMLIISESEYDYFTETMTDEEILNNYKCCVIPMANVLNAAPACLEEMQRWTALFNRWNKYRGGYLFL